MGGGQDRERISMGELDLAKIPLLLCLAISLLSSWFKIDQNSSM